MSKIIKTVYRNGRIEMPPDIQLPENTQVTVVLPDNPAEDAAMDPAYSIPGLAGDIGPEELALAYAAWAASHSPKTPVVLDDSRQSIYEDEDR